MAAPKRPLAPRSAAILAWTLLLAAALPGLLGLQFETTTESVLDTGAPEWGFYQESVRLFGGDEVLVVAVPARDEAAVSQLLEVAGAAEQLQGVRRVDSLGSLPLVGRGASAIEFRDALDLARRDGGGAPQAVELAATDPVARGVVVSDDAETVAVAIYFEDGSPDRQVEVLEAIGGAAGRAWVSGVPLFKAEATQRTRAELAFFVPVTAIVVGVLLGAALGLRSMFAVLLTASMGSASALALMGFAGVPVTISTMILPSILFVLGAAYSLHVVHDGRRRGHALGVGLPVFLSGLTTAVGFGALVLVEIPVVRQLGVFGALGVLAQVAAVLTLLPALIPSGGVTQRRRGEKAAAWVATWVVGRTKHVVLIWAGICAAFALGVPRLHVETDAVLWFAKDSEVRRSYDEIRSRLSGISPINVVLDSGQEGGLSSAVAIQKVWALERYLESLPEVGKAVSIATPLMRLHQQLAEEGESLSNAAVDQYLLLLESVDYARDLMTPDMRTANVMLRVDDNGSRSLLDVADRAVEWWGRNGELGVEATATGVMHEFARSEEAIAWGQVRGLGVAFVGVAIVLALVLRSVPLAVVSLLPNAVPLVMVFGVLGFAGVPLDAVTVGIGSLILGIAVDDTLHVAFWYKRGLDEGLDPAEAISRSITRVLRPVAETTIAVAFGFSVLALSNFAVTTSLGAVTAFMMVICLAADLTLLPALLLSFTRLSGRLRLRG